MMTEAKRARRRRDLARMKARAVRLYPQKRRAIYWADYLAVCSCAGCGNPRRFWKVERLTLQERKAAIAETEAARDGPI